MMECRTESNVLWVKGNLDSSSSADFETAITRLATRIQASSLMREGKPLPALRALTDLAADDPVFRDVTAMDVAALLPAIEGLPDSARLGESALLSRAGTVWRTPKLFVLLARSGPTEQARFDYYRQVDALGDVEARAHVGGDLLQWGMANRSEERLNEGLSKLKSAARDGSAEAMLLLGDAALAGALGDDRAGEALKWAGQAAEKGRPSATSMDRRPSNKTSAWADSS